MLLEIKMWFFIVLSLFLFILTHMIRVHAWLFLIDVCRVMYRDNQQLPSSLHHTRDQSNTLVSAVEHISSIMSCLHSSRDYNNIKFNASMSDQHLKEFRSHLAISCCGLGNIFPSKSPMSCFSSYKYYTRSWTPHMLIKIMQMDFKTEYNWSCSLAS